MQKYANKNLHRFYFCIEKLVSKMETTPVTSPKPQNTNIRASIFYINDMHAQYPRMPQIKQEADTFELTKNSNPDVDTFVMAGGDSFISGNKTKNKLVSPFLNLTKVEYSAMGNHDVDKIATLEENLCNTDTKFVVSNLKHDGESHLDKYFKDKIVSSTTVEKNGHKYGIIGAAPFKLNHSKELNNDHLSVDEYEKTKSDIANEVKNLKEQGIDKIIMVSHIGYANDSKIAKEVSGIDIIVGGHSHDLVEGLKAGQNLITAPDGNPVVITQAGQNGEFVGKLDVEFDSSGKIVAATNKVKPTKDTPKSLVVKFFEDRILGKATPLGTVTRVDEIKGNVRGVENPYADFFADAMRTELDADVAFINSAAVRGKVSTGQITDLDIKNLLPFENPVYKVKVSEEQIVDVLKDGAKSTHNKMLKPGITQVSGLRYKIDEKGDLESAEIQNKDGSFSPLNIKDPSDDKKYTAIIDEFMLKSDEYKHLNDSEIIESYPFETTKLSDIAINYIKKLENKDAIEFKLDGRIENKSLGK